MYKILQNAALIVLVALGTFALSRLATDSNHVLAIESAGLFLMALLAGDVLRTLLRN